MQAKQILVVDDDRDLVASIEAFMHARGYEVVTAHSGIEAREQLKRMTPDAVILDIMMDYETDGFNVAYKLRNEPATHDVPVIILSGFTQYLETKGDLFAPMMDREWPAARFFEKPVALTDLVEAVGNLIAEREALAADLRAAEVA
jgi:DNA-binding response OmpR family regulator